MRSGSTAFWNGKLRVPEPHIISRRSRGPAGRSRRVSRQLDAAPLAASDVSASVFSDSPDSFQAMALRTADNDTIMDEALRNEVDSFKYISLDDTVNERPLALVERIYQHARRAKFPWLSSTFRTKENLEVANTLAGPARVNVQYLWFWYKDVFGAAPVHSAAACRWRARASRVCAVCGGAMKISMTALSAVLVGGRPGSAAPSLKETTVRKMMKDWLLSDLKPVHL